MVSDKEAKEILSDAHDFVNGDPEKRIQEFLLAKAIDKDDEEEESSNDEELEIGAIPFHENIQTELSKIFVDELYNLVSAVVRNEEKPISRYEAGNIERDEVPIQYLPVEEIPNYDIFDPFTRQSGFEETSYESFNSPDFQAFRVRDKWGDMFVAFRKFSKRQIVGSSWQVKLTLRDSEYDVFEENLIALPENIDAFVYDGILFVINQGKFEDIFDYFTSYKQSTRNVLDELEDSQLTIHDEDLFERAVLSDRTALRKMVTVERRGLYKQLEREQVEEVIEEFDLDVNVREIDGEWGITLSTRGDKKDVIRILNDDHLYSEITDSKYQSLRKRPVSR